MDKEVKSNWEKAEQVVAFTGSYVVAPIAVGSGGTILVRYLAKAENIISFPWMAGMSGMSLALAAGFKLLGRNRTANLRKELEAQAAAKQNGQVSAG